MLIRTEEYCDTGTLANIFLFLQPKEQTIIQFQMPKYPWSSDGA